MTSPPRPFRRIGNSLQRWSTLIRLAITTGTFALGFYGFFLQDHPATLSAWFNTLFNTLGLLTLQFPHEIRDAVWQLNLARFLLPLFALLGTIHLVTGNALRPLRYAFLGVFDRPVLLSLGPAVATGSANGMGGAGSSLLRELATLHVSRAATGLDIPADLTAQLDRDGVPLLIADPGQPDTWRRLRVDHARLVIVAHGDDLANLNATAAIAEVLRESRHRPQPGILVLIERTEIADQVEIALDLARSDGSIAFRRLALADHAVQPLFLDPLLPHPEDQPGHLVILGWCPPAPNVLRHALTLMQHDPASGPTITIFADPAATARDPLLRPNAIPPFVANLRLLPWDGTGPLPPDLQIHLTSQPLPTLWCICLDDEAGIITALALGERFSGTASIAVHQARMNTFLPALGGSDSPLARLRPFGGILPDGAVRRILDVQDDALPREMHRAYLAALERQGAKAGTRSDWSALTETLRHANRVSAAHLPVKLAAIGCRTTTAPLAPNEDPFAFTESELARLVRIEHRRWCADRLVQGWHFSPMTEHTLRLHGDLVDFDALDAESHLKDRDAILALPDLLRAVGLRIIRDPTGNGP